MNAYLQSITDIQEALLKLASDLEAVKKHGEKHEQFRLSHKSNQVAYAPSRLASMLVMKLHLNAEHAGEVSRQLVRETIGSSPSIKLAKRFEYRDARDDTLVDVAMFDQVRDAMNYARTLVDKDSERPIRVIDSSGDTRTVYQKTGE